MEKHYTLAQASKLLGIKIRTAREWIHRGKLIAVKYPVSNRWFVSEEEVRRLINDNKN